MSLFKVREFWSSFSEDDEYFDQNSLITTKLNGDSDFVITGSQSGVLRIFTPSFQDKSDKETNFDELKSHQTDDLILEKIFDDPILQVGCGRFVSGSQNVHLVTLHPHHFSIFHLTQKEGAGGHGVQNILQLMYEHKLKRPSYNLTIGPFGQLANRDFICVQSLDGHLFFYEQESFGFTCALPDCILPNSIGYNPKSDSFLIFNSNWFVDNYSYKILCEFGQKTNGEKTELQSNWSFNLGEGVLECTILEDLVSKEVWIVILGERNLFILTESGRLKSMKKLDFSPICFTAFILDGGLSVLLVSETNTLLVYQNTTLKWSAQLQFTPIVIRRANLKNLQGALILLSEEGRLECCYLGTEPSLFVAPPLTNQSLNFESAGEELALLTKKIKESTGNSDLKMANSSIDNELKVTVSLNPNLEFCNFPTEIKNRSSRMCTIQTTLEPKLLLEEVQVSIFVKKPFQVEPPIQFFYNLTEKTVIKSCIFLNSLQEVSSLSFEVAVSMITNVGAPKTIIKSSYLPLELVMETCQAQKECQHKITLNFKGNPVGISTLFPEFDNSSSSSIAFKYLDQDDKIVTILLAKNSDRYRIQSNSFPTISLLVEQLIVRLQKQTKTDLVLNYSSSLPSTSLIAFLQENFEARKRVNTHQTELTQLSTQFRVIQKRLLAQFRAKNPAILINMETLLDDTYSAIIRTSDSLDEELTALETTQVNLGCALQLIVNLIGLTSLNKELKELLTATFGQDVTNLFEVQNFEDVLDGSLCYLLRTTLSKSEKDRLRAPQTSFDEVKDISKLEKHLQQVLERCLKTTTPEVEEPTIKDPEDSPVKELQLIGTQIAESSSRILSANRTRTLLERRHKLAIS